MRTIKTKESLKEIGHKGKPIMLSSRDKARIDKVKEKIGDEAKETQKNSYASPVDYAISQTQDKTKKAVIETSKYGVETFKDVYENFDSGKNGELSNVKLKAVRETKHTLRNCP